MTREEAIEWMEETIQDAEKLLDKCSSELKEEILEQNEVFKIAISALRPISREQVEKSWAGCEYCEKHKINLVRIEMNCNDSPGSPKRLNPTRVPKFCPMCGRPLTDEAVQMVMERLEALKDDKED